MENNYVHNLFHNYIFCILLIPTVNHPTLIAGWHIDDR
jgi:hypothetical protein